MKSQQDLEKRLDLILLEMAHLQCCLDEGLMDLKLRRKLNSETEKYISSVTSEIMFWIDECTLAAECPNILLRRMEIHLERLRRLSKFVEDISGSLC